MASGNPPPTTPPRGQPNDDDDLPPIPQAPRRRTYGPRDQFVHDPPPVLPARVLPAPVQQAPVRVRIGQRPRFGNTLPGPNFAIERFLQRIRAPRTTVEANPETPTTSQETGENHTSTPKGRKRGLLQSFLARRRAKKAKARKERQAAQTPTPKSQSTEDSVAPPPQAPRKGRQVGLQIDTSVPPPSFVLAGPSQPRYPAGVSTARRVEAVPDTPTISRPAEVNVSSSSPAPRRGIRAAVLARRAKKGKAKKVKPAPQALTFAQLTGDQPQPTPQTPRAVRVRSRL